MVRSVTWQRLKMELERSRNISFTLDYARRAAGPMWSAVLVTERGRVVGRATSGEADAAINGALDTAKWGRVGTRQPVGFKKKLESR